MQSRYALVLGGTLLSLGCGHTEPFTTATETTTGPFSNTPPVRLTYAAGANLRPAFSADGSELLYSYERGTDDRDRCLGGLPSGGGTRTRAMCWRGPGEDTDADGLELGALATDGRLAFTRNSSAATGRESNNGALYLTTSDDVVDAENVLTLHTFRPDIGVTWDYLLDLTWSGANELTALAAEVVVVNLCSPAACWDTTFVGLHLATLDVSERPLGVEAIAVGPDAAGFALDRATGRRYLRYPDRVVELTAGGIEVPVYTAEGDGTRLAPQITGLAVGNGRVVVSEAYTIPAVPPRQGSRIVLLTGETPTVLATRDASGRYGRLALSPAGDRLVYEDQTGGAVHLFLQELP